MNGFRTIPEMRLLIFQMPDKIPGLFKVGIYGPQ